MLSLPYFVTDFREDPARKVGEVVHRYPEMTVRDLAESNFWDIEVAEARGTAFCVKFQS